MLTLRIVCFRLAVLVPFPIRYWFSTYWPIYLPAILIALFIWNIVRRERMRLRNATIHALREAIDKTNASADAAEAEVARLVRKMERTSDEV